MGPWATHEPALLVQFTGYPWALGRPMGPLFKAMGDPS